jgi:DNA-binding response OmpR family regulator
MDHVLVVDDDRATRHLIAGMLESEGFRVTAATDAFEAAAELAKQRYDLLLIDVWMPKMTGLKLIEGLRAEARMPRTIVMTADDTPETMLRAVREQACRYLNKPFDSTTLLETVRAALATPELPPIEVISAKPSWVELLVPCHAETANRIEAFLSRLKADLPEDVRDAVSYAFREMLMNAIEWGGRSNPSCQVRIAYLRTKRMLLYRIADPGKGFRLDDLAHAATGDSSSDPTGHLRAREEKGLRPGGFGILITQSLVDEFLYNEAQNEVVLVKYLD